MDVDVTALGRGRKVSAPQALWRYDPAKDWTKRQGVWLVWGDCTKTSLYYAFPADQEIQARRRSDEMGYGIVEFVEFGVEQ